MALTVEKIVKLRELAERGIGGEKQTAIDILTKNGIDWRKPKPTKTETIKQIFGFEVEKTYTVEIKKAGDILLIGMVLKSIGKAISLNITENCVSFRCRPSEVELIKKRFFKNRDSFDDKMWQYANRNIPIE